MSSGRGKKAECPVEGVKKAECPVEGDEKAECPMEGVKKLCVQWKE